MYSGKIAVPPGGGGIRKIIVGNVHLFASCVTNDYVSLFLSYAKYLAIIEREQRRRNK
jgi:hypothetical protein